MKNRGWWTLLVLLGAAGVRAGDFEVLLNTTNGADAFRVQDADSRDLMVVRSDGVCELPDGAVPDTPEEQDPVFTGSPAFSIDTSSTSAWSGAYGWGDHADAGYATGTPVYAESDPVWTAESSAYATTNWVAERYLLDPPVDGVLYGRKNAAWAAIEHGTQQIPQADVTLTVGAEGDFQTINDAITYAVSRYMPAYKTGGYKCYINLLSGFEMNEQVIAQDIDLSWIWITSEDAVVPIHRASMVTTYSWSAGPAFAAFRASAPTIATLFEFDEATNVVVGLLAQSCARASIASGCGFINADYGVVAMYASSVTAMESIFDDAKSRGVYALHGSVISAPGAHASNAGGYGFNADHASVISADYAIATNVGVHAFTVQNASSMSANGSVASKSYRGFTAYFGSSMDCMMGQAKSCGQYGVYSQGSIMNARAVDAASCTSYGFVSLFGTIANLYQSTGTVNMAVFNALSVHGITFKP